MSIRYIQIPVKTTNSVKKKEEIVHLWFPVNCCMKCKNPSPSSSFTFAVRHVTAPPPRPPLMFSWNNGAVTFAVPLLLCHQWSTEISFSLILAAPAGSACPCACSAAKCFCFCFYEGLWGRADELVSGDALGCCWSSGVLSACSEAKAEVEYLHWEEPHSQ